MMSQMFTFAKVWQWLSYSDEQSSLAKNQPVSANRPLYRYGGHIEFIRFKEYYRMPRGNVMGKKILVLCFNVIMITFFPRNIQ